jgi:hypothetical protein
MGGDRLRIGAHLAEQQRLEEAPGGGQQVQILHRAAQLERAQHVALDVDVAGEIGIADPSLVDAGDGAQRILVLEPDLKARRPLAEALHGAVGHDDLERHRDLGELTGETAQHRPRSGGCRAGGLRCSCIQTIRHHAPDEIDPILSGAVGYALRHGTSTSRPRA